MVWIGLDRFGQEGFCFERLLVRVLSGSGGPCLGSFPAPCRVVRLSRVLGRREQARREAKLQVLCVPQQKKVFAKHEIVCTGGLSRRKIGCRCAKAVVCTLAHEKLPVFEAELVQGPWLHNVHTATAL